MIAIIELGLVGVFMAMTIVLFYAAEERDDD